MTGHKKVLHSRACSNRSLARWPAVRIRERGRNRKQGRRCSAPGPQARPLTENQRHVVANRQGEHVVHNGRQFRTEFVRRERAEKTFECVRPGISASLPGSLRRDCLGQLRPPTPTRPADSVRRFESSSCPRRRARQSVRPPGALPQMDGTAISRIGRLQSRATALWRGRSAFAADHDEGIRDPRPEASGSRRSGVHSAREDFLAQPLAVAHTAVLPKEASRDVSDPVRQPGSASKRIPGDEQIDDVLNAFDPRRLFGCEVVPEGLMHADGERHDAEGVPRGNFLATQVEAEFGQSRRKTSIASRRSFSRFSI